MQRGFAMTLLLTIFFAYALLKLLDRSLLQEPAGGNWQGSERIRSTAWHPLARAQVR